MPETTPLIKAALNLRVGAGFDVYIRPFTLGRKNWLFGDTPKGADASAMVYTMVEMAQTPKHIT